MTMIVKKVNVADDGDCNFCSRQNRVVYQIQGFNKALQARICWSCWEELRKLMSRI